MSVVCLKSWSSRGGYLRIRYFSIERRKAETNVLTSFLHTCKFYTSFSERFVARRKPSMLGNPENKKSGRRPRSFRAVNLISLLSIQGPTYMDKTSVHNTELFSDRGRLFVFFEKLSAETSTRYLCVLSGLTEGIVHLMSATERRYTCTLEETGKHLTADLQANDMSRSRLNVPAGRSSVSR